MYKENFITVVKNNNKILREDSGKVLLPFGAEYSILMKNKNSSKVVVDVEVDGKNVLDGHSLIIEPGRSLDLKGFMKGTTVTNKFKFINKTEQIANYRGDRIDDGLIGVKFRFEKVKDIVQNVSYTYYPYHSTEWWAPKCYSYDTSNVIGSSFSACNYVNTNDCVSGLATKAKSRNVNLDEGITVKGSKVKQDFVIGFVNDLGPTHAINILLRGYNQKGNIVNLPITTRNKLVCSTCGKKSKSSVKFCSNCGTYLE